MNTVTNEPGIVGKDFLKLLKSGSLRSLVARRYIKDGELKQQVEITIEPYVDGERQPEQRYEFPGVVRGSIFSGDGHASTVRPEGSEVVGTALLWGWAVRDFVNLIRVGDRLTFELQGANNSELTREVGFNLNEVYLVIDRPNKPQYEGQQPGFKRICKLLLDARVERAGSGAESVYYRSL